MIYSISGTRENDTKWDIAHALKSWCDEVGLECDLISAPSEIKQPGSTVLVWGWRQGKYLQSQGYRVIVMERGYIGDRMGKWTSIAEGGLNGRGKFHGPFTHSRLEQCHPGVYQPWRPGGEYALIIGQVPGDQSLEGIDPISWASQVCMRLKHCPKTSSLPVMYRPHPIVASRGDFRAPYGAIVSKDRSLEDDIYGAKVVITYSSTTAVQSLLAGRPTIAQGMCSMAWGVAPRAIEDPWEREPDNRHAWASMLACKQWTIEEMITGIPFEFLK